MVSRAGESVIHVGAADLKDHRARRCGGWGAAAEGGSFSDIDGGILWSYGVVQILREKQREIKHCKIKELCVNPFCLFD